MGIDGLRAGCGQPDAQATAAAAAMRRSMACAAALAAFCVHAAAWARDEPPTAFSKQVTVVAGDWVADDWRRGRSNMHPPR